METDATQKARQVLDQYAGRHIAQEEAIAKLVANGAPDDPNGTGTAYSAQLSVLQLDGGSSISQVLGRLGLL